MTKQRVLFAFCFVLPLVLLMLWLLQASQSLQAAKPLAKDVPIAAASEDTYCSQQLKMVLRRVAGACGLLDSGGRGCKPADAKVVAALSGTDFNALFKPLSHRVKIIQFDPEIAALDKGAEDRIEQAWSDRRGASYFFVVARASADGATQTNQTLSQARAEAVLQHLQTKFNDPDIKQQIGLLWLGEEYAQLSDEFCQWERSRDGACTQKDINRSAFIAWIDCTI